MMEIYTLGDNLERIEIIDLFESLIWTERFNTYGDFEIVLSPDQRNRSLLTIGTQLAMNQSNRIMNIENIEQSEDSEGRDLLKISGRSLEAITENRVAKRIQSGTETEDKWALTGTPRQIMAWVFSDICIDGDLSIYDKIPFISTFTGPGGSAPPGDIPWPTETISVELDIQSVYKVLKDVCEAYSIGWMLRRVGIDSNVIYFTPYTGFNRTTGQSTNTPVVFSPVLDNLDSVSQLTSSKTLKTTVYVYGKNGFRVVNAPGQDDTMTGFDRKVMYVVADDIDLPAGPDLQAALLQRGMEALAQNKATNVVDGEVPQYSRYKIGEDYFLGDLVEMRNSQGVINYMRVTENIWTSDATGERSYPTLSVDQFLNPGAWASWFGNHVWETAPGTWAEA